MDSINISWSNKPFKHPPQVAIATPHDQAHGYSHNKSGVLTRTTHHIICKLVKLRLAKVAIYSLADKPTAITIR